MLYAPIFWLIFLFVTDLNQLTLTRNNWTFVQTFLRLCNNP